MTHRIEVIYEENNCKAHVQGEPYLLINLEEFVNLNNIQGLSHPDFIYIERKDNRYKIYIVELVNTKNVEKLYKELQEFKNKFCMVYDGMLKEYNKSNKFRELCKVLNLNINANDIHGVLVLPSEAIDTLFNTLGRRRMLSNQKLLEFYNKTAWLSKSCYGIININNKFKLFRL